MQVTKNFSVCSKLYIFICAPTLHTDVLRVEAYSLFSLFDLYDYEQFPERFLCDIAYRDTSFMLSQGNTLAYLPCLLG